MKLSQNGIDFILKMESLSLKAYKDVAGRWTIGYGHLLKDYIAPITGETAMQIFLADALGCERVVDTLTGLNQNQFDALVSFTFNVGMGAFLGSTLYRRLKVHDYKGAAEEFPKWKFAGGKIIQGLINRRQRERDLFEQPPSESGGDTSDTRGSVPTVEPECGRDVA